MPQDLLGWTKAMEGSARSGGNRINQFLANRSAELLLGRPKSSRGSRNDSVSMSAPTMEGLQSLPPRACQKPEAALSTKNPTSNDALPFPLKRDEDLPMPRSIPGMAYGRAGNGEMISSSLGPPFRPRPRPSRPPCMLIINDLREAPPSLSPSLVARSILLLIIPRMHAEDLRVDGHVFLHQGRPGQRCSVIPSQT